MFIDVPTDNCRVTLRSASSIDSSTLDALRPFAVANVGDAEDRLNLMNAAVTAQWAGARVVGLALTVRTREGDNLAIHRALDEAKPGDILVINGQGDGNRSVFGDLLAEICLTKRVAGVVIDGAIRDRDAIAALGLPVWATGVTPAGPTKNGPGIIGEPIACGGLVVSTGDIIIADGDGVAVVAASRLEAVLERLTRIEQFENALRQRIRDGEATQQGVSA